MTEPYAASHATTPLSNGRQRPARRRHAPLWVAGSPAAFALMATVVLSVVSAPLDAYAAPPRAAAPSAHQVRSAEALATEAKALFRNKAFGDAARLFMEAYAVMKRAALVYNAARARQENQEHKRAESLFLMYLDLADATPRGRTDANKHLATVRVHLQKAKQARMNSEGPLTGGVKPRSEPPVTRPPTAATTGSGKSSGSAAGTTSPTPHATLRDSGASRWPWVASAAGAMAIVAGGTYGIAYSKAADLDLSSVNSSADAAAYREGRDAARNWRSVAVGAGIAAVGLGAWAGYLLLRKTPATHKRSAQKNDAPAPSRATLAPLANGRGMAFAVTF